MRRFHDRKFQVGVFTLLKMKALVPQHVLKMFIYKFLAVSFRTHFGSSNIQRNAEAAEDPAICLYRDHM